MFAAAGYKGQPYVFLITKLSSAMKLITQYAVFLSVISSAMSLSVPVVGHVDLDKDYSQYQACKAADPQLVVRPEYFHYILDISHTFPVCGHPLWRRTAGIGRIQPMRSMAQRWRCHCQRRILSTGIMLRIFVSFAALLYYAPNIALKSVVDTGM